MPYQSRWPTIFRIDLEDRRVQMSFQVSCRKAGALLFALALAASVPAAEKSSAKAFPEAEGFGAQTPGGRGGKVLLVTNLEDYVPKKESPIAGSFRAACAASGPRIIVFRVSGTIPLKAHLSISEPFITIAGQTAPGGGICLKNYGLWIVAHDVIVRHLRVRPGDDMGPVMKRQGKSFETDGLSIGSPARDVIIDHCSTSWANDEVLSVSGAGITNVTVQWCLISESLNSSFHHKGPHGYGSLLRTNGDVSFHHNLYAYHTSRSPRPGTYGEGSILLDFRNNVIYDSVGYSAADPVRMNYVGNFIKRARKRAFNVGGETTKLFAEGNVLEGPGELITNLKPVNKAETAFPIAAVATDSAQQAYERVLASSGATLPERDAVDQRIIKQVVEGTGGLIDSQEKVGGWPPLRSDAPPADADQDGMPDAWEQSAGLNPQDPADAAGDLDRDGYTNIEEWLNGTDAKSL
jgi:pectate lyase